MRGGLRRHLPNPVTLEASRFQWGNVNTIPDSSLNGIPTGAPLLDVLADGNLLKGSGSAVYVMEGGRKRHITSPEAFTSCGYGWGAVKVIADSRLEGILTGSPISGPPCPHLSPPMGSLLKGTGSAIYVMRWGLKRQIPNPVSLEAYGHLWGDVNTIADSALEGVPVGEPLLDVLADGNLLKGTGSAVYVMEGGLGRHVTSPEAFTSCGYAGTRYTWFRTPVWRVFPRGSRWLGRSVRDSRLLRGDLFGGVDQPLTSWRRGTSGTSSVRRCSSAAAIFGAT